MILELILILAAISITLTFVELRILSKSIKEHEEMASDLDDIGILIKRDDFANLPQLKLNEFYALTDNVIMETKKLKEKFFNFKRPSRKVLKDAIKKSHNFLITELRA